MQKAIKMCLAAAVFTVSEAVSIKEEHVIDTRCEKKAIKSFEERKVQCDTIPFDDEGEIMCQA